MEKLVTVRVMQERYGCSLPTARKYIRQCIPHMEKPLATTWAAVNEWEYNRTVADHKPRARMLTTNHHVKVPRRR